jgi:hypothetical protein
MNRSHILIALVAKHFVDDVRGRNSFYNAVGQRFRFHNQEIAKVTEHSNTCTFKYRVCCWQSCFLNKRLWNRDNEYVCP